MSARPSVEEQEKWKLQDRRDAELRAGFYDIQLALETCPKSSARRTAELQRRLEDRYMCRLTKDLWGDAQQEGLAILVALNENPPDEPQPLDDDDRDFINKWLKPVHRLLVLSDRVNSKGRRFRQQRNGQLTRSTSTHHLMSKVAKHKRPRSTTSTWSGRPEMQSPNGIIIKKKSEHNKQGNGTTGR